MNAARLAAGVHEQETMKPGEIQENDSGATSYDQIFSPGFMASCLIKPRPGWGAAPLGSVRNPTLLGF